MKTDLFSKLDSVSFLYIWGSFITWLVITIAGLLIALLFYTKLPSEIPIQWSDGLASSLVDKNSFLLIRRYAF